MMIKAVILDLDGTVYKGNRLIVGADEAISFMREKGMKVLFCTNNSSKPVTEISRKLESLGIPNKEGDVISSAQLVVDYVIDNNLKNVYLCVSDKMRQEFKDKGINTCRPEECDTLIIGMDVDFNYAKMTAGLRAALEAKKIIVCNKDRSYPTEDGISPGCGAIVASILEASGKKEDLVLGKPSTTMLSFISKKFGFAANEMMVIGDTESSDIAMADAFGSPSLLIGRDTDSLKNAVDTGKLHLA